MPTTFPTRSLAARLLTRPAILAIASCRIIIPGGRTQLVVTLHGWGWIAAVSAGAVPRWRDWRFFAAPNLPLLAPVGDTVKIVAANCFGRTRTTLRICANTDQLRPVDPLPHWPSLYPRLARTRLFNVLLPPPQRPIIAYPMPHAVSVTAARVPYKRVLVPDGICRITPLLNLDLPPDISCVGARARRAAAAAAAATAVLARYDEQ